MDKARTEAAGAERPSRDIPNLTPPSTDDQARINLWKNVVDALKVLPSYFESRLNITGVLSTDLFSFNSSLGATIEQQVVEQLNRLRRVWDPTEEYSLYRFERQSQVFPDVVLRSLAAGASSSPLLGIELKGWYVLAKEREPSLRFTVTPNVCSDYDLVAVFPWVLSDVTAGSPRLFEPYLINAKAAAGYRNWWWQHKRKAKAGSDRAIKLSDATGTYPVKSDQIADIAVSDGGGNFGRLARTDMMEDYKSKLFDQELSGIPLDHWQRFFSVFANSSSRESERSELIRHITESRGNRLSPFLTEEDFELVKEKLREIVDILTR